MTETKERICTQYECGQPYYYSLPEFGNLCKGCFLRLYSRCYGPGEIYVYDEEDGRFKRKKSTHDLNSEDIEELCSKIMYIECD